MRNQLRTLENPRMALSSFIKRLDPCVLKKRVPHSQWTHQKVQCASKDQCKKIIKIDFSSSECPLQESAKQCVVSHFVFV